MLPICRNAVNTRTPKDEPFKNSGLFANVL